MLEKATESTFYLHVLLNAAEKAGAKRSALMKAVGIPPELLTKPEGRTSMSTVLRLLEEGIRMTGEPALGVLAAEGVEKLPSSLFHLLMACSPTLRMAARMTRRFYRLASAVVVQTMEETEAEVNFILGYRDPSLEYNLSMAEFFLSMWVRAMFLATQQKVPYKAIHFTAPRPAAVSVHEQYFQAPLLFGQPRNQLVFDPGVMNWPVQLHDPELLDELIKAADSQLAKIPLAEDLAGQVRYILAQSLPHEHGSLKEIAAKMGLGERTLQRRLKERRDSFKELLDSTRHNLALGYLRNQGVSIPEITLLLGFSEIKSFYRAFQRWTGTTPAKMRHSLLDTGSASKSG